MPHPERGGYFICQHLYLSAVAQPRRNNKIVIGVLHAYM